MFGNGELTPETGAALINSGEIDAAVFGRLFIAHPDLVARVVQEIPLDNQIDWINVYGLSPKATLEESKKAYIDYPEASNQERN